MYNIIASNISQIESDELNDLIKSEIKNTDHKNETTYSEIPIKNEDNIIAKINDSQTTNIIGIIAIIFGLTIFTTIIYKARKKK